MKFLSANLVALLSLLAVGVRAADVTFGVNMQYQVRQGAFVPGTDRVVVLGSFSGVGVALTDPDGDQVYTATVPGQAEDTQLTYGYRLTHAGAPVGETVAARPYVVQATSAANVLTDWWNDQLPPYPYARFYASSATVLPGEVVRLADSSEGGAATSWSWTFAGGTPATATTPNPTVVWSAPGTYAVTLTATNASGSTTAQALTVTVTSADSRLGWWNDAVFYEIYPRSFLDTNNNGTGDFAGLLSKLDYLNDGDPATTTDLGVTALYLMPIHPATNLGYGGYEVTDYKAVNSELGTQISFTQLVAAAHQRGMKVILDMVFNHSSFQHPWFTSAAAGTGSQYEDYYVWRPTNPGSAWRANPYGHSSTKVNYFWGKFGAATPDLNFYNPSVRNTIKDISSYWLGLRNVDGFRVDAAPFLYETGTAIPDANQQNLPATYAYWRDWRRYIKANANAATQPNPFSVGETWLPGIADMARYTYQGFDVGFQFDVAYGLEDALNYENQGYLSSPVEQALAYYPFLQIGIFASNHDLFKHNSTNYTPLRIKDRLADHQDAKARVAAAWVLTAPGVPFLYYGDEIGISSAYARSPMQWDNTANAGFSGAGPWAAVGGSYPTYNVATEQADPNSLLTLHKQLIAVRKAEAALRRGSYQTVSNPTYGVYSFVRTYGAETVFVLLNLAASAQPGVALTVGGLALPAGTYAATNLLDAGQPAQPLTVGAGGSVSGWVPYASLAPNGIYILKVGTPLAAAGPAAAPALAVYPNPSVAGRLTVQLPGPAARVRLQLLDGQGRLVRTGEAAVTAGRAELDAAGLAPGLYLLQATAGGTTYTSKVLLR